jgi:hypothetical protein
MSKSKLGDVLSNAGVECNRYKTEQFEYDDVVGEGVALDIIPDKNGKFIHTDTEISPSDIVEIDVEKIKLIILEWQDFLEKRSKRSSGIFAYDRNVLAETLAENADILKFKSK